MFKFGQNPPTMNLNKTKAVIIDDEPNNLDLLEHFISKYCPSIRVVGKYSDLKTAIGQVNELKPEMIFLDIVLDEGATGFDLLDQLNYTHFKVIFVTAFNEFAVKAFKYNAVDYLLKPIEIDELILAVDKARSGLDSDFFIRQEQWKNLGNSLASKDFSFDILALKSSSNILFVKLEDICYCNSQGRYTVFHLVNGQEHVVTKNLGEYESILKKEWFVRVHNSYIVNVNNVVSIEKTDGNYCKMSNSHLIPIAKRRLNNLTDLLNPLY